MKIYPLVGLVLLLHERLLVMVAVGVAVAAALALHVALNLEGWRLAIAMIPGRDPIGMFGIRNLARGLPVLWSVGGDGGPAVALAYAGIGGLAMAVAVWCARRVAREALLDRLTRLDTACFLVFATVMLFCFLAAQNFMYRAIFLVPLLPVVARLATLAASPALRVALCMVLAGMIVCLWGGYLLNAVDHVQKAIHAVAQPPKNALRAVAWTARETCWWVTMAVVAALLPGVYVRMPVMAALADQMRRRRRLV